MLAVYGRYTDGAWKGGKLEPHLLSFCIRFIEKNVLYFSFDFKCNLKLYLLHFTAVIVALYSCYCYILQLLLLHFIAASKKTHTPPKPPPITPVYVAFSSSLENLCLDVRVQLPLYKLLQ